MKIGILGPGNIAEKMAYTINHMEDAQCYAVASRDLERAKAFAEKFGILRRMVLMKNWQKIRMWN